MKSTGIFLIVLALTSCGSYPCIEHPGLQVNFVSFSDADIQPFHFIRYRKGSAFQEQVDSLSVDSTTARFRRTNDTLLLAITGSEILLTSNYDYRIVVPATANEYRITDIEEEMTSERKSIFPRKQEMCVNPIRSYRINGTKVMNNDGDLFLKK